MIFSASQKHLFYSEMAKLLEAGFGVREAAGVMIDSGIPASQARLLMAMNEGLEQGLTITAAFGKDSGAISDLERSIIGAGERGGRLAPAFDHLAGYFALLASVRREAVKSMVYPLILLHFGVIVGIVPTALMAGNQSAGEIFADIVVTLVVIYVIGFALVALGLALLKAAPGNPAVDRMLNAIPLVGSARRSISMARFTKVYHTCVLAGLTISEAVETSGNAAHSGVIHEASGRLAIAAKSGEALGPHFLAEGVFPKAFARSYATAEESGMLDKDLARWAAAFQNDAERGAKTLSVVIPKVFYFLIVGYVLWKILGFYSGYFTMLRDISE